MTEKNLSECPKVSRINVRIRLHVTVTRLIVFYLNGLIAL